MSRSRGRIHNTSLSSYRKILPSKLEYLSLTIISNPVLCNISLLGWFITYEKNKVLRIQPQVPYSQHSIFLVTYELSKLARPFHNTMLERLTNAKHSNLLSQFVNFEENEVLWIRTHRPRWQNFLRRSRVS
jgi:hypothetical protein